MNDERGELQIVVRRSAVIFIHPKYRARPHYAMAIRYLYELDIACILGRRISVSNQELLVEPTFIKFELLDDGGRENFW